MPDAAQAPRYPDHSDADAALIADPTFWLLDLRLGRYHELVRNIHDRGYRSEQVARWFRTRRVLVAAAGILGLPTDGSVHALQQRVTDVSWGLLPLLAVAAFAAHKVPAAVEDAAKAALSPAQVANARTAPGEHDRLLLLLMLLAHKPAVLPHVRGLHAWHRAGAAALTLNGRPEHRRAGFGAWLSRENVERAVAAVPLPRGVPGIRFEMCIQRPDGDVILLLSRNLRRAHQWTDDGLHLLHGHDEELIVLHFLDDGRRVRVSAQTPDLPRALAGALAAAWFGAELAYVDDLAPAEPASLRRMLAGLLTRQVGGLRLVELAVRNSPLAGAPEIVLRAGGQCGDISAAVHDFEDRVGPLLDRLDDVVHLKVIFGGRRVEVDFPHVGAQPVARFADGRLDRHAAEAFRAFVGAEFGLPLHSMETRCA
jgi:hypothetical protein